MSAGRGVGCTNCDRNVTAGISHKTLYRENYCLAFELLIFISLPGTFLGQKDHTYFASQGIGPPCNRHRKKFVNWMDLRKVKRNRGNERSMVAKKLWLILSEQFDHLPFPMQRGLACLSLLDIIHSCLFVIFFP